MRGRDSNRRSRSTRLEHATIARSQRARAHLARVRERGDAERGSGKRPIAPDSPRVSPAAIAGIGLAIGVAAGAWGGAPILHAFAGLGQKQATRVDAIAVRGVERLDLREVAAATGVAPGADLASVDATEVASNLREHPWILRARAAQIPGGGLVVEVVERTPHGVVLRADDTLFAVDAYGVAFAKARAEDVSDLPRLVAAEISPLGEPNPALASAAALALRLRERGLPGPTEITISGEDDPEGFSLRLPDLTPRVVLGRDQLDSKLDALARVLAARPVELVGAEALDLRFEGQAVLRGGSLPEGATQAAAGRGHGATSEGGPSG